MVVIAGMTIYTAAVFIPKNSVFLSDLAPSRLVVIDTATNTTREFPPDLETQKLHVQVVLMYGALSGILGMSGILTLVITVGQVWEQNWHRKAFVDFLKATGRK